MSSQRGKRRASRRSIFSRLKSARVRAVLSLGIVLGFGAVSTMAYWTDSASLTTGSFTSGSMDMQFDTNGAIGLGTDYNNSTLTWSDFVPGQQKSFPLKVKNVGDANFKYSATVVKGDVWTYVDSPLQVQFFAGSVDGTGCNGTALTSAVVVPNLTPAGKSVITSRALAKNAPEDLCLVVAFDSDAESGDQNKTGSLVFNFEAIQDVS